MGSSAHRNRLATETSAYLLQHASNPVDWYPWGAEALARARQLDRPILLSIGYSACHWCHVMERESFEDPAIAALMNERFVCIKVDREERPDLDHLYMKALQGMTGRGGWPMTVFLTPDARPFYAGTYFPPDDRSGMPGLPRVLLGVSQTWSDKRGDVTTSAQRMVEYLGQSRPGAADAGRESFDEALRSLVESMDAEHGGFGSAPKFPATMALTLLMQVEARLPDRRVRELVRLTLDRMAAGGIRDHLGGGFHRYSVDRIWLVPHFEKMLYDQALIATLYADASRFADDARYLGVAEEIADYVAREMTSPEGGFYSAQDADSEGEEGKYFVWTRAEIMDLLGELPGRRFCEAYGVTTGGNFEGASILHLADGGQRRTRDERAELAAGRRRLLEHRSRRVAPGTDRKIVADWNGLMISAMVRVGRLAARPDLIDAAERAATFVGSAMQGAGGLRHVHAGGASKIPAFLDDYAFYGRACLDLFAARPAERHLAVARDCADQLLREFVDEARGGFFFTGSRSEALVVRTCELHDGAVPAGNSVAAELLLRLWSLTGDDDYRRGGQGVIDRFSGEAIRYPYGASWLLALAECAGLGLRTAVVVGEAEVREQLSRTALGVYDPRCTVIELQGEEQPWWPSALRGKTPPGQGAAVYICEGTTCSLPIRDVDALRSEMSSRDDGVMEAEEQG